MQIIALHIKPCNDGSPEQEYINVNLMEIEQA